jgi:hypothetical protein
MVAHEGPSEDSPTVEITHLPDGVHERFRLERVVEDELASCDAAVDVVRGSWDE